MKKLGFAFLIACFAFAAISVAQNNIVKSLERNVPGQGKVSIHQDARIGALIGSSISLPVPDDRKVIKSSGYRVQVYAGNNTRQAKNEAYSVASNIKSVFLTFPFIIFQPAPLVVPCRRLPQHRGSGCHDAPTACHRCFQGSVYRERSDKYPL